jgi:hypothetical protein
VVRAVDRFEGNLDVATDPNVKILVAGSVTPAKAGVQPNGIRFRSSK